MPATMRPSVDLPQPDSPTRPTTSPSFTAEGDVVHGVHDFVGDVGAERARDLPRQIERLHEALGDVLELEQRLSWVQGVEAAHQPAVVVLTAPALSQ